MRIAFVPLLVAATGLMGSAVAQDLANSQVIQVDSATSVRLWTEQGALQSAVTHDGGQSWQNLPQPNYQLELRFRSFDPLQAAPVVPPSVAADANNHLFIVQFVTEAIDSYRVGLRNLGAEIHTYLPEQSYVVRMDRATASKVQALPYVRWVGDLHPAFKVDPDVLGDVLGAEPMSASRYNVVMVDQRRDAPALEAAIRAAGGIVDMPAMGSIKVEATLTQSQLMQVASLDTVLWIDRWGAPEVDMDNARIQSGANYVESVAGIDGKGITGHIFEGVYSTHPEFAARPPYRTTPISYLNSRPDGHGNSTAGEVFGMGANPKAKGMLPYGQMIYTNYSGVNRYNMTQGLVDPNGQYRVMLQTASWGNPRTTTYTSVSADTDSIIFDFDLFVTQSQSNSGGRPSRPQAWAKNICSVGGFDHFDNSNPADDCWCRTGSTGPASDGRIGVTLAGYYDAIYTTGGSATSYTSNFGGTSGATPMCNGLGGEVLEMYTDGLFGYPGGTWQQRFDLKPHFTTTKALLSVSTRQMPFNKSNRFQQGWGFPNVQDLYDNRDNLLVLDEEDVLTQGDTRSYYVWVKPNTPELRIGMQYADPAAAPNASIHRINSLDLVVTDPSGTVYPGNGGLLVGPWSAPTSELDDRNTEECVFLQNPASGVYQVAVSAPAVRQDSHVETTAVDADFALAVRGIGGGRDRSGMLLDVVSNTAGQLDVALSNVPGGWVAGYTLFSMSTSRHPSLGNFFGLELDPLAVTSLQLVPTAGDVFAFTNTGGAGSYPNAPYSFPAGVAAAVQGLTFDAVVVLTDATGAVVDVSNVDRVTVQ